MDKRKNYECYRKFGTILNFSHEKEEKEIAVRDIDRLRKDGSRLSLMIPMECYDNLLEIIPSFTYYSVIFSSRAQVSFEESHIVVYFPVDNGRITSMTKERKLDHAVFCNLIDSGWIDANLATHNYVENKKRKYNVHTSRKYYEDAINQMGYGAHLRSLLYTDLEYEYDICSTLELPTDKQEGSIAKSILEETVDYLTLENPALTVEKDTVRSDHCLLYETSVPPSEFAEMRIKDRDTDVLCINSTQFSSKLHHAQSIPIDATQLEDEVHARQAVVHLCGQGDQEAYACFSLSLYERSSEVVNPHDMHHYTAHYTKYHFGTRAMVSKVLDLRAYRKMLIGEAVRHKKIKKYNPRQYLFLNVYVFGTARFRINIYTLGTRAEEKGPFFVHEGPRLRNGVEFWGYFDKARKRKEASPMTDERFVFVRVAAELHATLSVYPHHPLQLTSTARDLISPMHRSISVIQCICPIHGEKCGVSFQHKIKKDIVIPAVCYNLQLDLMEYVIIWLNTRYKRTKEGKWVYLGEEGQASQIADVPPRVEDLVVSPQILDYSLVYFIK
jgi:hypothetical protein